MRYELVGTPPQVVARVDAIRKAAERMTNDSDALIREVDEELRRDQLKKLWELYGTYFLAGAALILVGIGGNQWWQGRRVAAAEAAGLRFEEALNLAGTGKTEEAQKEFSAIAAGRRDAYATLAQLALAGAALKAGKSDEALAAYEAVAGTATDPLIKDFARVQVATLKIDGADWTDMQNRLNDLIGDKNPWRYTARELLGLAALKAGKLDDARQTLGPLSADPRVPAAIRERANAMMSIVVAAELEKTAPARIELERTEAPQPAPATPGKSEPTPQTRGGKAGAAKK